MSEYFLPDAARPTVSNDLAAEAWEIAMALEEMAGEDEQQQAEAPFAARESAAARTPSPR